MTPHFAIPALNADIKHAMIFKEYRPHPHLQHLVECYWKFVVPPAPGPPGMGPIPHVFPPDGSCSLVFIYLKNFDFKGIAFVGPTTVIKEVDVFENSINLGIRLTPGASGFLSTVPPAEITNTAIRYAPAELTHWQNQILTKLDIDFDDTAELDEVLLRLLAEYEYKPDARVQSAVNAIIAANGNINLEEVALAACISPRHLQRMFKQLTGISVKQFCQIRRLRKAVIDLHIQKKAFTEMAYDRGFADQAHYYKSFKNVAGYSMEKFFSHIAKIDHQLL